MTSLVGSETSIQDFASASSSKQGNRLAGEGDIHINLLRRNYTCAVAELRLLQRQYISLQLNFKLIPQEHSHLHLSNQYSITTPSCLTHTICPHQTTDLFKPTSKSPTNRNPPSSTKPSTVAKQLSTKDGAGSRSSAHQSTNSPTRLVPKHSGPRPSITNVTSLRES